MLRQSVTKTPRASPTLRRALATAAAAQAKREGDISDAFASMADAAPAPLPDSYRRLKLDLVRGRETAIRRGWAQLLRALREQNGMIAAKGPGIVPEVEFQDLERGLAEKKADIRLRGVVVVRGVVPEGEARAYKEEVEEYVRMNPATRGEIKKPLSGACPLC
jgi:hypothetical protein